MVCAFMCNSHLTAWAVFMTVVCASGKTETSKQKEKWPTYTVLLHVVAYPYRGKFLRAKSNKNTFSRMSNRTRVEYECACQSEPVEICQQALNHGLHRIYGRGHGVADTHMGCKM